MSENKEVNCNLTVHEMGKELINLESSFFNLNQDDRVLFLKTATAFVNNLINDLNI